MMLVPRRPDADPKAMVTVRMPPALHKELLRQAHELNTSLNLLCVVKLARELTPPEAQVIDRLTESAHRTAGYTYETPPNTR
jgi:hypothetical protein